MRSSSVKTTGRRRPRGPKRGQRPLTPDEIKTRNGMIWLLRGAGATYTRLGELFHLSHERVRQIVFRLNHKIAVNSWRTGKRRGLPVAAIVDIHHALEDS